MGGARNTGGQQGLQQKNPSAWIADHVYQLNTFDHSGKIWVKITLTEWANIQDPDKVDLTDAVLEISPKGLQGCGTESCCDNGCSWNKVIGKAVTDGRGAVSGPGVLNKYRSVCQWQPTEPMFDSTGGTAGETYFLNFSTYLYLSKEPSNSKTVFIAKMRIDSYSSQTLAKNTLLNDSSQEYTITMQGTKVEFWHLNKGCLPPGTVGIASSHISPAPVLDDCDGYYIRVDPQDQWSNNDYPTKAGDIVQVNLVPNVKGRANSGEPEIMECYTVDGPYDSDSLPTSAKSPDEFCGKKSNQKGHSANTGYSTYGGWPSDAKIASPWPHPGAYAKYLRPGDYQMERGNTCEKCNPGGNAVELHKDNVSIMTKLGWTCGFSNTVVSKAKLKHTDAEGEQADVEYEVAMTVAHHKEPVRTIAIGGSTRMAIGGSFEIFKPDNSRVYFKKGTFKWMIESDIQEKWALSKVWRGTLRRSVGASDEEGSGDGIGTGNILETGRAPLKHGGVRRRGPANTAMRNGGLGTSAMEINPNDGTAQKSTGSLTAKQVAAFWTKIIEKNTTAGVGIDIDDLFHMNIVLKSTTTTKQTLNDPLGESFSQNNTASLSSGIRAAGLGTWLSMDADQAYDQAGFAKWKDSITLNMDWGSKGSKTANGKDFDVILNPDGTVEIDQTSYDAWAEAEEMEGTIGRLQSLSCSYNVEMWNGWSLDVGLPEAVRDEDGVLDMTELFNWNEANYTLSGNPEDPVRWTLNYAQGVPELGLATRVDILSNEVAKEDAEWKAGQGGAKGGKKPTALFDPLYRSKNGPTLYLNAGATIVQSSKPGMPYEIKLTTGLGGAYKGFQYAIDTSTGETYVGKSWKHNFANNFPKFINKELGDKFEATFSLKSSFNPLGGATHPDSKLSAGVDIDFQKTLFQMGEVMGRLVLQAKIWGGLSQGGGSGPIQNQTNIGFGVVATLWWENNILEWFGLPFNLHPGISAGMACSFNFGGYTKEYYNTTGGSDGPKAIIPSQRVQPSLVSTFHIGNLNFKYAMVDNFRAHLKARHKSIFRFVGLGDCPILKVLGPKEGIWEYIFRVAPFRAMSALGVAGDTCGKMRNKFWKKAYDKEWGKHNRMHLLPNMPKLIKDTHGASVKQVPNCSDVLNRMSGTDGSGWMPSIPPPGGASRGKYNNLWIAFFDDGNPLPAGFSRANPGKANSIAVKDASCGPNEFITMGHEYLNPEHPAYTDKKHAKYIADDTRRGRLRSDAKKNRQRLLNVQMDRPISQNTPYQLPFPCKVSLRELTAYTNYVVHINFDGATAGDRCACIKSEFAKLSKHKYYGHQGFNFKKWKEELEGNDNSQKIQGVVTEGLMKIDQLTLNYIIKGKDPTVAYGDSPDTHWSHYTQGPGKGGIKFADGAEGGAAQFANDLMFEMQRIINTILSDGSGGYYVDADEIGRIWEQFYNSFGCNPEYTLAGKTVNARDCFKQDADKSLVRWWQSAGNQSGSSGGGICGGILSILKKAMNVVMWIGNHVFKYIVEPAGWVLKKAWGFTIGGLWGLIFGGKGDDDSDMQADLAEISMKAPGSVNGGACGILKITKDQYGGVVNNTATDKCYEYYKEFEYFRENHAPWAEFFVRSHEGTLVDGVYSTDADANNTTWLPSLMGVYNRERRDKITLWPQWTDKAPAGNPSYIAFLKTKFPATPTAYKASYPRITLSSAEFTKHTIRDMIKLYCMAHGLNLSWINNQDHSMWGAGSSDPSATIGGTHKAIDFKNVLTTSYGANANKSLDAQIFCKDTVSYLMGDTAIARSPLPIVSAALDDNDLCKRGWLPDVETELENHNFWNADNNGAAGGVSPANPDDLSYETLQVFNSGYKDRYFKCVDGDTTTTCAGDANIPLPEYRYEGLEKWAIELGDKQTSWVSPWKFQPIGGMLADYIANPATAKILNAHGGNCSRNSLDRFWQIGMGSATSGEKGAHLTAENGKAWADIYSAWDNLVTYLKDNSLFTKADAVAPATTLGPAEFKEALLRYDKYTDMLVGLKAKASGKITADLHFENKAIEWLKHYELKISDLLRGHALHLITRVKDRTHASPLHAVLAEGVSWHKGGGGKGFTVMWKDLITQVLYNALTIGDDSSTADKPCSFALNKTEMAALESAGTIPTVGIDPSDDYVCPSLDWVFNNGQFYLHQEKNYKEVILTEQQTVDAFIFRFATSLNRNKGQSRVSISSQAIANASGTTGGSVDPSGKLPFSTWRDDFEKLQWVERNGIDVDTSAFYGGKDAKNVAHPDNGGYINPTLWKSTLRLHGVDLYRAILHGAWVFSKVDVVWLEVLHSMDPGAAAGKGGLFKNATAGERLFYYKTYICPDNDTRLYYDVVAKGGTQNASTSQNQEPVMGASMGNDPAPGPAMGGGGKGGFNRIMQGSRNMSQNIYGGGTNSNPS